MRHPRLLSVLAALVIGGSLAAQGAAPLDSTILDGFRWRSIGPANMGGRVADIAGIPSPSKTFYVAAAGGGIWKTTNAGITFRPVFDHERVISMGALAIAPSDTNIVWAGTGEQNSRNTIEPGGGIYKSTDGGKTWTLMGLVETQQIGRIVVHPTDPNIVYVAALGHAWGPNKERGLYKTTDGGKSWQLIKFVSDKAGFIDVAMDPSNPDVLYASSYERVRGPYFLQSGGPGSALWKTTDAGKTWTKVQGGGFPETMLGRIGLAISRSNPSVVYALVEADSLRGKDHAVRAPASDSVGERVRPPKKQRLLSGLYRSADGGKTWKWMNDRDTRPFYYSQVRVDPERPDRVYWSSTPVQFSDDGGKTVRTATNGIHVDHHAMWIDPKDPQHFVVGDDGGVSQTWDRGGNYVFLNVFPIGQFYEVSYDFSYPYRVCGGLQDNGSWCGPSRKRQGAITNNDWFTIGGGDGFYTAQDAVDPNILYAESQGGNVVRTDYRTGERKFLVKPSWRTRYLQIEDSILVQRPDTTKPETAEQKKKLSELRRQQVEDSIALDMRFNWNAPFFLSVHNPSVFYMGGNRVLKSTNRGDDLYAISPDLSTRDTAKIRVSIKTTGGITVDATGAETYGTVVALAESPIRPGLLFAGTDDGNAWLTRNDGATWENLTGRFPGVPAKTYVVRIEPSHFDSATFYIAFDNHRNNDFTPYLFVTNDFGRTFRSLAAGLPTGGPDYVHVIREDPVDRDLLFVGTDVGAYVSRDRGAHWQKFMTGLPTVAVHDLKIQPREHELIAATHGRSLWIVDIAALEQLRDSVLAKGTYLFAPKTAYEYGEPPGPDIEPGQQVFEAASPPFGADLVYRLASGTPKDSVKIVITDVRGDTVKTLSARGGVGLHHVAWDLRGKAPKPTPLTPAARRDSLITAQKMDKIVDSLAAEGVAPKPVLERLKARFASGAGVADLFQRGGPSGQFQDRPGEGPAPRTAPAKDTTRARGEGGGAEPEIPREVLGDVFEAVRAANIQISFGGGGRGAAPLVESGDYLVTMVAGGETQKQVLRVERAPNAGTGAPIADTGDDDP